MYQEPDDEDLMFTMDGIDTSPKSRTGCSSDDDKPQERDTFAGKAEHNQPFGFSMSGDEIANGGSEQYKTSAAIDIEPADSLPNLFHRRTGIDDKPVSSTACHQYTMHQRRSKMPPAPRHTMATQSHSAPTQAKKSQSKTGAIPKAPSQARNLARPPKKPG